MAPLTCAVALPNAHAKGFSPEELQRLGTQLEDVLET